MGSPETGARTLAFALVRFNRRLEPSGYAPSISRSPTGIPALNTGGVKSKLQPVIRALRTAKDGQREVLDFDPPQSGVPASARMVAVFKTDIDVQPRVIRSFAGEWRDFIAKLGGRYPSN